MSTELALVEQIAEALRAHCTGTTMPQEAAGLELPPPEGYSKRDRARAALSSKSRRELAQIARDLGRHLNVYGLEEAGLLMLEEGTPPITEITRRDVARCFGDDPSGERNPVELVRSLFSIGSVAEFFVLDESRRAEAGNRLRGRDQ